MKMKFIAAAFALALAVPAASMANGGRHHQFGGQAAGIVQGLETGEDFSADSIGDEKVTQGGNVVKGNVTKGILQLADVGGDLDLTMVGGERNTQGLNVVSGKVTALVGQIGVVDEDAALKSVGNEKSAQGINVVNACEGCQ
ncbi:MAG: hypothetical protein ACL93V_08695 [Candidatus Electrothrix sp. YB6]